MTQFQYYFLIALILLINQTYYIEIAKKYGSFNSFLSKNVISILALLIDLLVALFIAFVLRLILQ